jgi:hypothetical protein
MTEARKRRRKIKKQLKIEKKLIDMFLFYFGYVLKKKYHDLKNSTKTYVIEKRGTVEKSSSKGLFFQKPT